MQLDQVYICCQPKARNMQTSQPEKLKILIARKQGTDTRDISLILGRSDIEMLMADNGQEAIRIFISHPEIKMVLINSDLPMMNGFDATYKIRETDKDIPIILLVNYSNRDSLHLATLVGCSQVLQNPVDPEAFEHLITKYLHRHHPNHICLQTENK